jgi:hypothetical protein
MTTSSRWRFAVNNCEADDERAFENAAHRAHAIIGREVGENGTPPRLQGYITFGRKMMRLSAMKRIHATAHFEVARGSTDQNIANCCKDGNFVEFGDCPKR